MSLPLCTQYLAVKPSGGINSFHVNYGPLLPQFMYVDGTEEKKIRRIKGIVIRVKRQSFVSCCLSSRVVYYIRRKRKIKYLWSIKKDAN